MRIRNSDCWQKDLKESISSTRLDKDDEDDDEH